MTLNHHFALLGPIFSALKQFWDIWDEPGTEFGILCCQIYLVTKDQDNVTRAGAIQHRTRPYGDSLGS